MYVADRSHHTVDRVTGCATTCVYTAIAGTGTLGYTGEGASTSFRLSSPQGVAVDSATHDVYIADANNKRIRKVTQPSYPTGVGVISTVAGDGTSAVTGEGYETAVSELKIPLGVGYHGGNGGNVYIADTSNNLVRKIVSPAALSAKGTGYTSIIVAVAGDSLSAGNGFAGDGGVATWQALVSPVGMASDGEQHLHRRRRQPPHTRLAPHRRAHDRRRDRRRRSAR